MRKLALVFFSVILAACGDDPAKIIIEDQGVVRGLAYMDRDGDGSFSLADAPLPGVIAFLVLEATGDTIARDTTAADGLYLMDRVPSNRYRLLANRGTAGDTVQVELADSAAIGIAAGDTVIRNVRLSYPRVLIADLRLAPSGRRVMVDGLALNSWSTFGDSTVHIIDQTGAVRALRVQPFAVQPGDSVRLTGTTSLSNGRIVLTDATGRVLVPLRTLPAVDSMSTQRAATADNGRVADASVRIAGVITNDTATIGAYRRVRVDDGSGAIDVLLSRGMSFPVEAYQPGASITATGLLVPSGTSTSWQLKVPSPLLVTASFPTMSATQVRLLPVGRRINVYGIALNSWGTFNDSTVHIQDGSGAIRAVRAPRASFAAGDSLHILGTTGLSDNHIALVDAVVRVVALSRVRPPLDSVSTLVAASAASGARADGQVRVAGAMIVDTAHVSGEWLLGVDDGSGRLEVLLDRNVTFDPAQYVPGATFTGAGVLAPAPNGLTWRLKPRDRTEATITYNAVSTTTARAAAIGTRLIVDAVALNSWNAFGDSTVHFTDRTTTMRAVRVVGNTNIAPGDSIRLIGVVSTRNGQPVLFNPTASLLLRGVGTPETDSISTGRAATADGGALDAARVTARGTILGVQPQPNGDQLVIIDDGSGRLDVILDQSINFSSSGPLVPGAVLSATGFLVPTGTGRWQLKPAVAADARSEYPTVTIAQARQLPTGRQVYITGIALNGRHTYGDNSVHVKDATGALRITGVPSTTAVFMGDSVRILGTIALDRGQTIMTATSATVPLANVGVPAIDTASTRAASEARRSNLQPIGAMDADQMAVFGTITAIETDGSDEVITIDDSTGKLIIRLDKDVGFLPGTLPGLKVDDRVRVRGLLVPNATGTAWELRPRTLSEIAKL
jgi:hypothetical protein